VIAIYDSNWYIRRLNNIEIDKKKLKKMRYFGPLNHNRRRPYPCLPGFKPLVTAMVYTKNLRVSTKFTWTYEDKNLP